MQIGNISDDIMEKLKTACPPINIREDDYMEDGVLHCGKCHKPKEKVKRRNGKEVRFGIACGCKPEPKQYTPEELAEMEQQAEERREREREQNRKEYEAEVAKKRDRAFDDIRLKKWRFDTDDGANPTVTSIAKNYVRNFQTMLEDGKGLLFYGGVGTGKTYIAACIANALIEQDYGCKLITFTSLIRTLETCDFEDKDSYMRSIQSYPLLIIDDLGSERKTEYVNETVFEVIDTRHKSGKPLIVTTNLTGEELKHPKDLHSERIFSRLFEMCIPIEVKGQDRRKLTLRDGNQKYKELLGIK